MISLTGDREDNLEARRQQGHAEALQRLRLP